MRHYLFLCVIMTLVFRGFTQDIVFPKHEESPQLSGNNPVITERVPVYIPERCPENMLLYPGQGDKSSWVCDCKPKFLYFPLNNTCHEAYKRGPCEPEHYVHLPAGDVVPRCVRNVCYTDGVVPFQRGCYSLGLEGPCGRGYLLDVNATTFQIECIPLMRTVLRSRILDDSTATDTPKSRDNLTPQLVSVIAAPGRPCPPGTQKISSGSCRTLL